jgi:hypothetical protein
MKDALAQLKEVVPLLHERGVAGDVVDWRREAAALGVASFPGDYQEFVAAFGAGQVVHYTVTPRYVGSRTVPVSFELAASGVWPDGSAGLSFSQPVPNSIYSPEKGWKSLGTVTDSRTGMAVPTGAMP